MMDAGTVRTFLRKYRDAAIEAGCAIAAHSTTMADGTTAQWMSVIPLEPQGINEQCAALLKRFRIECQIEADLDVEPATPPVIGA